MQAVGDSGRTVLFVSHDMTAVTRLCPRAILLDEGRVLRDGPSHDVVSAYLMSGLGTTAAREWPDPSRAPGNDIVRLHAVRIREEDGNVTSTVDIRRPVGVEIEFEVLKDGHLLVPGYQFINEEGVCVFVAGEFHTKWGREARPAGRYTSTAWIPGNFLAEGTLIVAAGVFTLNPFLWHFFERDAVAFHIIDSLDGGSARGDWGGPLAGVVRPMLRWTSRQISVATEPA
jgi:lipopolysaccharide transport system ATP-binding protein